MSPIYNIVTTDEFHQSNPAFVCRDWALHLRLSEQAGYQVKCRNPRCSLSCYQHYRAKQSHIVRRLITAHLPANVRVYRGNLRLKDGSTLQDHNDTLRKFLLAAKRYGKRHHVTLEILTVAHVTGPRAMHHDLIAYSDLPKTVLRKVIKETWRRAGGTIATVPELDTEAERLACVKYTLKDTQEAKAEYRYLPAKNRMNLMRSTRGFWQGQSKAKLWSDLLALWFPKGEDTATNPTHAPIKNSTNKVHSNTPNDPQNTPLRLPLEAHAADLEVGTTHDNQALMTAKATDRKLRDVALSYIAQHAPRTPETALILNDLQDRLSIPTSWLSRLIPHDECIHRTEDHRIWRSPLGEVTPTPPHGGVVSCNSTTHRELEAHAADLEDLEARHDLAA